MYVHYLKLYKLCHVKNTKGSAKRGKTSPKDKQHWNNVESMSMQVQLAFNLIELFQCWNLCQCLVYENTFIQRLCDTKVIQWDIVSESIVFVLIWAPSSEFVSSSIPSWQISTAHVQPFRGARDLVFCLKVPLIHCLYVRAAKVLARLRECAGSPELSLLA